MGIWGDFENAASDVVHAGRDVVDAGVHMATDVAGMIASVENFITDAGLGNVVQELEQLANQANQLRQRLASAASSTGWAGPAASAFEGRARQRQSQIAALVDALDAAHSAVGNAYVIAGIF